MTNTLRFPPAEPAAAAEFFAAELAFEADPDDVVRDLESGAAQGFQLVETRSAEAFAHSRIPTAIHLDHREMDELSTKDLDRDLVYVCYCESFQCNAATKGALRLARLGFRVKRLSGGITAWRAAGYPIAGDSVGESGHSGVRCAC